MSNNLIIKTWHLIPNISNFKIRKNEKKFLFISCHDKNKIAVTKTMKVNKCIVVDKRFVESLGIYIGDGKLTNKDSNHLELSTIDVDIAKYILYFFIDIFNVSIKDFTLKIKFRYGDKDKVVNKWSEALGIIRDEFIVKRTYKYKRKDNLTIQINSKVITLLFKELIRELLPLIKDNKELRHAFLRGMFAADGKFIVEKDANSFYISEMTFCYDKEKERWLRDFILNCLRLEGINEFSIVERENDNGGFIRITGWKNYFVFWNMKIFDMCERKKIKFLNTVRQMHVYLDLMPPVKNSLLDLPNKEILSIIHLHRTNLSRVRNNVQLLTLEQINILKNKRCFSWDYVLNGTKNIRVGKITNLDFSRSFVDFLIETKGLKG